MIFAQGGAALGEDLHSLIGPRASPFSRSFARVRKRFLAKSHENRRTCRRFPIERRGLSDRPLHPFGCTLLEEVSNVRLCRGLCGYESKTPPSGLLRRPFGSSYLFYADCRGLSGRPLHPFGCILYKGNGYCKGKYLPCIKNLLHPKGRRRGQGGDRKAPLKHHQRKEIVNPSSRMPEGVKGGEGLRPV